MAVISAVSLKILNNSIRTGSHPNMARGFWVLRSVLHTTGFCAVLCAITPPEHPGHQVSSAVASSRAVRAQTRCVARVSRHSGQLASLAVGFAWFIRNEEAGGSNPLSSTKLINNLHRFSKLQELPALPKFHASGQLEAKTNPPPTSGGSPRREPIPRIVR